MSSVVGQDAKCYVVPSTLYDSHSSHNGTTYLSDQSHSMVATMRFFLSSELYTRPSFDSMDYSPPPFVTSEPFRLSQKDTGRNDFEEICVG